MAKHIAVETLTLGEVSEMFQESFVITEPKFNNWLQFEKKKLRKLKITIADGLNLTIGPACHVFAIKQFFIPLRFRTRG